MRRRSLTFASTLGLTAALAACAPDIGEPEVLPNPDSVVIAQFDPTNPIPQLQLIPTPTALAENPDQTINKDAVRPAPCELPTTTQCLEFVDGGWPANLPPTFFFSAPLVMDTLAQGLKVYEVTATGLEEVEVTIAQVPRAAPPEACQSGNNGSNPPRTFTPNDVTAAWGSEAIDVVMSPTAGAFKPGTQYIAVATNALRGAPAMGESTPRTVEPSSLFYLLNSDTAPVEMDGTITDPLLRANVQASVLDGLFPGRDPASLDPTEQAAFQQALNASGVSLFGLYQFVNGTIGALVASGRLSARSEALIVNTWTTGAPTRAPTEIVFDPAATDFPNDIRFPLPNDQLLTVPSSSVAGGLQVAFPTEGLSPTLAATIGGLNTLNGFGLTTPIIVRASRNIDPDTLAGNVIMQELDPTTNMPTGTQPQIAVVATASTPESPPQIFIQPVVPLKPNTRYAVGITTGVRDMDNQPVTSSLFFNFMKIPTPLIDGSGTVNSAVEAQLQCSTLATTGALAPAEQVAQLATGIEVGLQRARWQVAFQAFEGLTPPIERSSMAMAFTYKTQSITDTVDFVKATLLPNVYEALPPMMGRVLPTNIDVVDTGTTTNIAQLMDINGAFCLPACRSGALEPALPRDQCDANAAAVAASPVCQLFTSAFTSNLGRVRAALNRYYRLTVGNPFVAGTFTEQSVQTPQVEYAPFLVITPKGTPPANGWPTVIFQHGLGSSKEAALFIANTFAQAGWATVAMDLVFHGQRASDISNNATGIPCTDIDPNNVTCDLATGMCTGGCDGLQDSSGTGAVTPNPYASRDALRQGIVDHLAFLRTLFNESGAGQLLSDLDTTRLGYVGQSLGGITGGNLIAYVTPDELDAAVLNVAGGNQVTILTNTVPSINAAYWVGLAQAGVCELEDPLNPAAGCRDTPLFRLFLLLNQWVTEPGDPKGNSVGVIQQLPMRPQPFTPDRVLMQISQPDPVVSNLASIELGLSYGFDLVNGDPQYQVYDFSSLPNATQGGGCHGFILAPICGQCTADTLCNTFGAQQQAAGFVNSGGMSIANQRPASLFSGTPFEIDCSNPCN